MKHFCFTILVLLTGCENSSVSPPKSAEPPTNQPDTIKTIDSNPSIASEPELKSIGTAIDVLATSKDLRAVSQAEKFIRKQGYDALTELAEHMDDSRIPPTKDPNLYQKLKNVTHIPQTCDYCFWTIQELVLDSISARVIREFCPFDKSTVKQWISTRSELNKFELRRDAALGVTKSVGEYLSQNPEDSEAKEILAYYEKRVNNLNTVISAKKKTSNSTP